MKILGDQRVDVVVFKICMLTSPLVFFPLKMWNPIPLLFSVGCVSDLTLVDRLQGVDL